MNTVGNIPRNPAYKGVYEYDGVVAEGAVPPVDAELWQRAQDVKARRRAGKRRGVVNDYMLTGKVWCLRCGKPMCGTAGTSQNGTKYTYYGCVSKEGCGLRVPSGLVEGAVSRIAAAILDDPGTFDAIARDMVEYGATLTSHADEWAAERSEWLRRRDNYVDAIGDGVPYQSVAKKLSDAEGRIAELGRMIAEEEAEFDQYRDLDAARDFLRRTMRGAADDDDLVRVLIGILVERIYVDRERMVLAFNLTDRPGGDPYEYTVEELRAIADGEESSKPVRAWSIQPLAPVQKRSEPAGKQRVRMIEEWSAKAILLRTNYTYSRGPVYVLVCPVYT